MSASQNPDLINPAVNMQRFPYGRLDKFMLIPLMEEFTEWLTAGPLLIGVEARAIGNTEGEIFNRGPSVHIFDANTREEWLRFDCFDHRPHYHYILNGDQHNIVWGFDPATNGEVYPWVVRMLGERLGAMLRNAGANDLADKLDASGLDKSMLQRIATEMDRAYQRTFPGTEMIEPAIAWARRWKALHPQFNTFAG